MTSTVITKVESRRKPHRERLFILVYSDFHKASSNAQYQVYKCMEKVC